MNITYLNCDNKNKLFSFYRHDYRQWIDPETGILYMIDGGDDYVRKSKSGTIEKSSIEENIEYIREQFTWGKNYDKSGNLLASTEWIKLSKLSNLHIISIIEHLYKRNILNSRNIFIFLSELKHRTNNKIYIYD